MQQQNKKKMDLAKSLFENRNHEGYVGKDAHTVRMENIVLKLVICLHIF